MGILDVAYERIRASHFSQSVCPKDMGIIWIVCVFPLLDLVNSEPCDMGSGCILDLSIDCVLLE